MSTSELVGHKVLNVRGERLGKIDRLLYQGDRDEPDWVMIKLGWFGRRGHIIPLEHTTTHGGSVHSIDEREWVSDAPEVELDGDRMTDEDAERLRDHYGLERVTAATIADDDMELPRETREAKPPSLEEGPDSPITQRRRERARELGIPTGGEPQPDTGQASA